MRTIAVMSPKGGIGKTTTADSLAYILGEEMGKKILLIDGDPQGDTSKIYHSYEASGVGMSEMLEQHKLVGGKYNTEDLIKKTDYEKIDIIPANGYLITTDMKLLARQDGNQITLKKSLEEVQNKYDYCICDCGRLLDMVVINILLASDIIIAPVKTGGFEAEALQNLTEQVEELKALNPNMRIKVLMTMRQKNKLSEEMETWLREKSKYDIYDSVIRRSVIAEKSTISMLPLPKAARNSIAVKDYRKVAKEILKEG